ncbi:MAG: branched-chain amino acid ABC transporter permease [Clostridiales bacterium]|jgi:branched-chain amino acid transport system permease protein|nr:branched-chain amino acid ABC transporter permease [Clostridiales bacterium]
MITVLNIIISGLIMGGIYALISMGLSLQYGVARILNVTHGEFIMTSAFLTWVMVTSAGINPLLALVICCPITFLVGFVLHITIFRWLKQFSPVAAVFESNAMLVCFGLMFIISNIAMQIWGSNNRGYQFLQTSVEFAGTATPANRLVVLVIALAVSFLFYLFLARSRMGKSIRAASQDSAAADMLGVKINMVMAICFGIGALLAGIAGSLLSMIQQIYTNMGMQYTAIALIVVVLGGMGSIPGSMLGGFILGMVGSIVSYLAPSLAMVAFYVIILALLLVKPKGLMGR